MSNHEELITQAKSVIEYLVKETDKEKELKVIVRDLRDKLIEIDKNLNDDVDGAFEQALDKVVDKVDDFVPFVTKKFLITSVVIAVAIISILVYITY